MRSENVNLLRQPGARKVRPDAGRDGNVARLEELRGRLRHRPDAQGPGTGAGERAGPSRRPFASAVRAATPLGGLARSLYAAHSLVSRHRSSVGLRWPSKRIAALHRLPIRSVWAARYALRCAPMAARSLRHLIG